VKNYGFDAWKARLEYMGKDQPFTKPGEGIKEIRNEVNNLHADNEPAWRSPTRVIWYKDGRKHGIDADIHGSIHYYYENIRIPPKYHQAISNPEILSVEEVLKHPNQEVKYVGMKIVGFDRVMTHKNCKIIHTDKSTDQVLFEIKGVFDEPIKYVRVWNSTAEPDGSYKPYYLCVPPETKTCKQGVAWTFRKDEKDYNPSQET
jgi:hypothetical protein